MIDWTAPKGDQGHAETTVYVPREPSTSADRSGWKLLDLSILKEVDFRGSQKATAFAISSPRANAPEWNVRRPFGRGRVLSRDPHVGMSGRTIFSIRH